MFNFNTKKNLTINNSLVTHKENTKETTTVAVIYEMKH